MSQYDKMIEQYIKKMNLNYAYGKMDWCTSTETAIVQIHADYREEKFGGLKEHEIIAACKKMFPENFV